MENINVYKKEDIKNSNNKKLAIVNYIAKKYSFSPALEKMFERHINELGLQEIKKLEEQDKSSIVPLEDDIYEELIFAKFFTNMVELKNQPPKKIYNSNSSELGKDDILPNLYAHLDMNSVLSLITLHSRRSPKVLSEVQTAFQSALNKSFENGDLTSENCTQLYSIFKNGAYDMYNLQDKIEPIAAINGNKLAVLRTISGLQNKISSPINNIDPKSSEEVLNSLFSQFKTAVQESLKEPSNTTSLASNIDEVLKKPETFRSCLNRANGKSREDQSMSIQQLAQSLTFEKFKQSCAIQPIQYHNNDKTLNEMRRKSTDLYNKLISKAIEENKGKNQAVSQNIDIKLKQNEISDNIQNQIRNTISKTNNPWQNIIKNPLKLRTTTWQSMFTNKNQQAALEIYDILSTIEGISSILTPKDRIVSEIQQVFENNDNATSANIWEKLLKTIKGIFERIKTKATPAEIEGQQMQKIYDIVKKYTQTKQIQR